MSTDADRTIAELRVQHDTLAARVADLSDEELGAQSGAAEWTVAQVLSHLGSGAEIMIETLRASIQGNAPAGQEFAQGVWDRWNALAPRDQAAGYLEHDENFVAAFEALDTAQRDTVRVALSWMPQPVTASAFAGLRLGEATLHGWDAQVGLDPAAEVSADAATLMFEHYTGDLGILIGFLARGADFGEPVGLDLAATGYVLNVSGGATVTQGGDTTAALVGPAGSALRLISGRVRPPYDEGVTVTGNVTLDQLRAAFTGY